jgi:hypothetical protein
MAVHTCGNAKYRNAKYQKGECINATRNCRTQNASRRVVNSIRISNLLIPSRFHRDSIDVPFTRVSPCGKDDSAACVDRRGEGVFLMAIPLKDRKPASLPAPSGHVYGFIETLPAEELAVVEI